MSFSIGKLLHLNQGDDPFAGQRIRERLQRRRTLWCQRRYCELAFKVTWSNTGPKRPKLSVELSSRAVRLRRQAMGYVPLGKVKELTEYEDSFLHLLAELLHGHVDAAVDLAGR